MNKEERIQLAKENAEANIELMAGWSHKKLTERLELVNMQSVLAEQKKDSATLDLLEVWRSQLIAARIHKQENNIPDALNEIQEAIADIETVVAQAEERKEILEEENFPEPTRRKIQSEKSSEDIQLPLF